MSKITLNTVGSLIDATTAATTINNNFTIIQTAMDNTLSRNGLAPNTIATPIDVNSNRIVNLPAPITANEPLRLIDLNTFVGGGTISSLPAGGVTGDSLLKTSNTDYAVGWSTPSIPTAQLANNAVTNAKAAQMAAFTIKGNATGSTANATDISIPALTQKVSPVSGDFVMIVDSAASNALKYSTVGGIAAIGSVSSIDAKTGTFTTGNGLDSTGGNVIELTPARRTLPTIQTFLSGSGTYTTPANCLWIEVYCQGAGGGASGASSGTTVAGTLGGTSTFNSINAVGGNGGSSSSGSNATSLGGTGGTGGTGTATRRMAGSCGTATNQGLTGQTASPTGAGGSGGLMGGGAPGQATTNANGTAGGANTGGGGSGACTVGSNYSVGGGGGGGEAFYLIINTPAASYSYTVGAGGAGGVGTTTGGAGGSGYIQVIEHYGT